MAGYPIHGKVAAIAKNTVAMGNRIGFELQFDIPLDNATPQGVNWAKWLAGVGEWGGKMDCMFDPSNTEMKALMDNIVSATPGVVLTDVVFQLEDSGDYFDGDIIITSFPVTANVGGKVTCSFSFKGNDAPGLTIA